MEDQPTLPLKKAKLEELVNNPYVRIILWYAFSSNAVWLLPDGNPPYKPCEGDEALSSRLMQELRVLKHFVYGTSSIKEYVEPELVPIPDVSEKPTGEEVTAKAAAINENKKRVREAKLEYNKGALKMEKLFIGVLETIDPEDAILLLAVKNKTLPYASITPKLVESVWPGLLKQETAG